MVMNGVKSHVKTMAILTSENPRYETFADGNNVVNSDRIDNLKKDLKLGHYAWFPVKGQYDGKENSFIIYNISLENVLYLGRKYGQEAIIFIDGANCEYWEQQGKGKYQKTHERLMKERLDMTDAADFFMQVSSALKCQIPFFDGCDENKNVMNETMQYVNDTIKKNIKDPNEVERRIETSINASSGYNRYCNRSILYSNVDYGQTFNYFKTGE